MPGSGSGTASGPVGSAGDYTDLATVKDELGIGSSDTQDDARLARTISDASRAVDLFCRQRTGTFLPRAETRLFDVAPPDADTPALPSSLTVYGFSQARTSRPSLRVPPLASVSSLATDEDGDGIYEVAWTAGTDYRLYPLTSEVKREVRANQDVGRYGFPPGEARVQITGVWGYLEGGGTPLAVRRATLLLAARYYNRANAPLGILGDDRLGFQRLMATDPDVSGLLWSIAGALREQWLAL